MSLSWDLWLFSTPDQGFLFPRLDSFCHSHLRLCLLLTESLFLVPQYHFFLFLMHVSCAESLICVCPTGDIVDLNNLLLNVWLIYIYIIYKSCPGDL